jgi:hypothetical protein
MAAQRKIYNFIFYFILLFLLFYSNAANSQSNYLHRRITVSFTDLQLEKALENISKKGGFKFSYNSNNFDKEKLVSLNIKNKTIAKSLNKLFDNSVRYKVVGSHIILMKKQKPERVSKENKPNEYIVTGYIIDSRTGRKIKQATVYEIDGRIVSLSNSQGFYSLTVPSEKKVYGLSYSKYGYQDTVIIIEPVHKKYCDIYLTPRDIPIKKILPQPVNLKLADIHNRQVVNLFVPEEAKIISNNLFIHENRIMQFSFIPYIGTNRKVSGSVDNIFSLNVLAGYSGGVKGFELGAVTNIVRRDVKGMQISGFANIIGGNTKYFQLAGFFNKNSGSVTGTQIAGFSNVVLDTINGVQIAGFNNTLHGQMNGIQISGFNNVTTQHVDGVQLTGFANIALKDVKLAQISGFSNLCNNVNGGQLSGFLNIAKGDVKFVQISGFANLCNNVDGGQLSGFLNVAKQDVNWGQISGFVNYGKSVKGIQLAGFGNFSENEVSGGQISGFINYGTKAKFQISGFTNIAKEEIKGIQASGFLNYAKKVNGCQIGILNVCDTIESGLPIGLFSFVKKGFHCLETSSNEVFNLNTALKFGVKKLYNSIRLGTDFSKNIYFGYGFGTQIALADNSNFNLDLSSDIIFKTSSKNKFTGTLHKLTTSIDYNLYPNISVFIGPSFNVFEILSDDKNNSYSEIIPYSFYNKTFSDTQVKVWVGGTIGLLFKI